MQVSHVIVKVSDLDESVKEFRQKGFEVEYGKKKNPKNALIFFSKGPYIEMIASTHMPKIVKKIGRIMGKGSTIDRLDLWDSANQGEFCGLALENYKQTLAEEIDVLKKYDITCMQMNNCRKDTKGRKLKFRTAFPNELGLPFLMTYFTIDPKPVHFIHPNGIHQITKVHFGTEEKLIPIIRELCEDSILELDVGNRIDIEMK